MNITFQRVTLSDVTALSALCEAVYRPYYAYLWHEGGMDWYIQKSYTPEQLTSEIADPNVAYYFVTQGAQTIGYCKFNLHSPIPSEPESNALEIQRVYFFPESIGKGAGFSVMQKALEMAKTLEKEAIWLHVMDSSIEAQAAYRRWGFVECGKTRLPFVQLKPELRDMFILKKTLY